MARVHPMPCAQRFAFLLGASDNDHQPSELENDREYANGQLAGDMRLSKTPFLATQEESAPRRQLAQHIPNLTIIVIPA